MLRYKNQYKCIAYLKQIKHYTCLPIYATIPSGQRRELTWQRYKRSQLFIHSEQKCIDVTIKIYPGTSKFKGKRKLWKPATLSACILRLHKDNPQRRVLYHVQHNLHQPIRSPQTTKYKSQGHLQGRSPIIWSSKNTYDRTKFVCLIILIEQNFR